MTGRKARPRYKRRLLVYLELKIWVDGVPKKFVRCLWRVRS
ncbi:MAG TPA: hypothetical protein VJ021_02415 [Thermoplasmata archaeon]|nr:hypothetical protein [Thermoplasmata archaeon]